MSPFVVCLWVCGGVAAACWVLSLITREYSWVDRIWSVAPVVYAWIFALSAQLGDPRADLVAGLITLWGARLTANFARKGGYAPGGEDYRWRLLRSRMSPLRFGVFNLLFIAAYQNALLLLITLPQLTVLEHPRPLGPLDAVAAAAFLVLLAGETVADEQQWRFHRWKEAERAAGRVPSPGFLSTGLFRYSRHPNFFSEQAQWVVVFLFGAIAAGSALQWTVLGTVLLVLLFVGSTRFTESVTAAKYPEYADYRRRTSPSIPWPPRRHGDPAVRP